jgi:hypothetical protein
MRSLCMALQRVLREVRSADRYPRRVMIWNSGPVQDLYVFTRETKAYAAAKRFRGNACSHLLSLDADAARGAA